MSNKTNKQIEKSVLRNVIENPAILKDGDFLLNSDDFYYTDNKKVFEALTDIVFNGNLDNLELELIKELDKKGIKERVIKEIKNEDLTDIKQYTNYLRELAKKRQIESFLDITKNKIQDKDIDTSITIIKKELEKLENTEIKKESYFNFKTFAEIEEKTTDYILPNFLPIPKSALTLLSAKGGSGKSFLALQIALRAMIFEKRKVCIWLSEDPLYTTKNRANIILNKIIANQNIFSLNDFRDIKILGSETLPIHLIKYSYKDSEINELFYQFQKVTKNDDLIIIDPLIAFFGGDENNNSQAREFMNLLTEWANKEDKAILVIHHNNKSVEGGIRGASAFVDAVRLQYELKIDENLPNNFRRIEIIKDNWGAKKLLKSDYTDIKIFDEVFKNDGENGENKGNKENEKGKIGVIRESESNAPIVDDNDITKLDLTKKYREEDLF